MFDELLDAVENEVVAGASTNTFETQRSLPSASSAPLHPSSMEPSSLSNNSSHRTQTGKATSTAAVATFGAVHVPGASPLPAAATTTFNSVAAPAGCGGPRTVYVGVRLRTQDAKEISDCIDSPLYSDAELRGLAEVVRNVGMGGQGKYRSVAVLCDKGAPKATVGSGRKFAVIRLWDQSGACARSSTGVFAALLCGEGFETLHPRLACGDAVFIAYPSLMAGGGSSDGEQQPRTTATNNSSKRSPMLKILAHHVRILGRADVKTCGAPRSSASAGDGAAAPTCHVLCNPAVAKFCIDHLRSGLAASAAPTHHQRAPSFSGAPLGPPLLRSSSAGSTTTVSLNRPSLATGAARAAALAAGGTSSSLILTKGRRGPTVSNINADRAYSLNSTGAFAVGADPLVGSRSPLLPHSAATGGGTAVSESVGMQTLKQVQLEDSRRRLLAEVNKAKGLLSPSSIAFAKPNAAKASALSVTASSCRGTQPSAAPSIAQVVETAASSIRSLNEPLATAEKTRQFQQRLDALDAKDQVYEALTHVTEEAVVGFWCVECRRWYEHRDRLCSTSRHRVSARETVKKHYRCAGCHQTHVTALGDLPPVHVACELCGGKSWTPSSAAQPRPEKKRDQDGHVYE